MFNVVLLVVVVVVVRANDINGNVKDHIIHTVSVFINFHAQWFSFHFCVFLATFPKNFLKNNLEWLRGKTGCDHFLKITTKTEG